jgi:ribosomal protein S25
LLSQSEVGTYYLDNSLRVPSLWNLTRKLRVSLYDGRFVKLNHFENRLNEKDALRQLVGVTTITSPQTDIEDVLCSKTRLKMLKILMQSERLTASNIAKRIAVNYVVARAHLEILEQGDILARVMFGKRIRYYKFKDSARAKTVKELIEAWDNKQASLVIPSASEGSI